MFQFRKVYMKLWKNKCVYLIMVLEFGLGMAFFTYSLNHIFSYLDKKREISRELSEATVTLHMYPNRAYRDGAKDNGAKDNGAQADSAENDKGEEEPPFTYADYELIRGQVEHLEVYFCSGRLFSAGEDLCEVSFIHTSLLNRPGVFCPGDEALKGLPEESVIYDGADGYYAGSRLRFFGREYRKEKFPDSLRGKVILRNTAEEPLYADRCIFFSLRDWDREQGVSPAQMLVRYEGKAGVSIEETNREIIRELSQAHPSYLYRTSNDIDDFVHGSGSAMEYAKYMLALAALGIWIMVFGYLGLTKQFYMKRQREFAVCLALGATKRGLFLEFLLENACILAAGIIGGSAGARWMLRFGSDGVFPVRFHMQTVLISVLLSALLLAGIHAPVFRKIRRLSPQEILKSL